MYFKDELILVVNLMLYQRITFPLYLVLITFYITSYYIDESVLLGTKPLVDSIRHFIRDLSGIFSVSPLWVSYRSMTSRFHSNDITIPEDMNFMFSWQEQYLTRSLRSLMRYCSCHSNIKFISSHHRVISSMYNN